jgi:hypothetical protein
LSKIKRKKKIHFRRWKQYALTKDIDALVIHINLAGIKIDEDENHTG